MCLLITNLVSYPIRLAFAVCKLLGQYLQFLSKTGGKNVQLVRRSLRKGSGGRLGKTEQSTQIDGTLCTSVVYRTFALSAYKVI